MYNILWQRNNPQIIRTCVYTSVCNWEEEERREDRVVMSNNNDIRLECNAENLQAREERRSRASQEYHLSLCVRTNIKHVYIQVHKYSLNQCFAGLTIQ